MAISIADAIHIEEKLEGIVTQGNTYYIKIENNKIVVSDELEDIVTVSDLKRLEHMVR